MIKLTVNKQEKLFLYMKQIQLNIFFYVIIFYSVCLSVI